MKYDYRQENKIKNSKLSFYKHYYIMFGTVNLSPSAQIIIPHWTVMYVAWQDDHSL